MVWLCLVLVTIAVARLTRLLTADQITLPFRRWVVNKYGDESSISYLVHCSWCTSLWISVPAATLWALLTLPLGDWWFLAPAALAMSYVTGLLSQIEER